MELAKAYVQIIPSAKEVPGGIASVLVPEASAAGDEAGNEAGSSFADKLKAALVAAGIGTAIKAAFSAVGDMAAYGDEIDKQSQKIGISSKAYQEWSAVLQHSGTDISAMQSAMRKLSNAAVDGSEAFEKLGISQEEAASMSQEDLFARVIEGLQGMEAGSERTALAQDLLGRSAQEMAALLNTSAEDTQKMKDTVSELGGVMSEDSVKAAAAYQDALQDMQTAISGLGRGILSEFLPSITEVMTGLTQVFAGDGEGMQAVISGIAGIGTAITEAVPQLLEAGAQILSALVQGIVQALPGLWDTATQMIPQIVSGFLANLPSLIEAGGAALNRLVAYLMQNLPRFLQSGLQMIGRLAMGLVQAIPNIVGSIARVLARLIATIIQNAPKLITQGIQLIAKLVVGIVRAIPQVVRTVPQIFRNVSSAFRSINWGSIGTALINGIKRGISNGASAIVNAAKGLASKAFNAAKDFLGIKSPSRKFRWIAEMSAAGIVSGTKDQIRSVEDAMADMARSALDAYNGAYDAFGTVGGYGARPASGAMYSFDIPLTVNGRELARATATYTQQELDRLSTQRTRREGIR